MLIVNVVNEDKPEQALLSEVTEDLTVERVLLSNGDHVDVNNANVEQVLLVDMDGVEVNTETGENAKRGGDTETLENADVNNGNKAGNANKTKVHSIEALVCSLRRAREQELLQAREVLDNLSELPFQVNQKMSGNLDSWSSCPWYTQGKGFRLWKQEVEAWKICVENPDNKTRLAVEKAVHLPFA
jgi:hypothetical protein